MGPGEGSFAGIDLEASWFALFPFIREEGCRIISGQTDEYNCVAWAAGRVTVWWQPPASGWSYWPPSTLTEPALPAFTAAYGTLGYLPCADGDLEDGVEKIALYVDQDGVPMHAARQLESGEWSSKLGPGPLIIHQSLRAVEGPEYGTATRFLSRPRSR